MVLSFSSILSMFLILIFIRFVSLAISIQDNFDIFWRPSQMGSFPLSFRLFLLVVAGYMFYLAIKNLKDQDNKTKTNFFLTIGIIYLVHTFFNRFVANLNLSYLYFLNQGGLDPSLFLPFLELDFFYESPYIFWCLLFMGFVYFICKNFNHIEYALPFWAIPCYFTFIPKNDAMITMHFVGCFFAILAMKFAKSTSPRWIILLQFLSYLTLLTITKFNRYPASLYFSVGLETLLLVFIPVAILLWSAHKKKDQAVISSTWIFVPIIGYALNLCFTRLIDNNNFATLIAQNHSLLFAGNIAIVVGLIYLLSFVFEKLFPKSGRFVSKILFAGAIVFYSLDAILFHFTQLRPDYQTFAWTLTMDNIIDSTLATCMEYLTPGYQLAILIYLIVILWLVFKSKKIIETKTNFRYFLIGLILCSQLSSTLMQASSSIPDLLRDPFFEMLKSLPISSYLHAKMPIEEIKKSFEECNLPLIETKPEEKAVLPNEKMNVIFITLESTHWRYLNIFGPEPKTWPRMSEFKDRMEIFPLFFGNHPESTSGDYACISGITPYNYFAMFDRLLFHKTLIDELKNAGYDTALFASGSTKDGNLSRVIAPLPIDYQHTYYSSYKNDAADIWQWGYKEEHTYRKIIEFLKSRNNQNPYFVWYRSVYPHAPFTSFLDKKDLPFKNRDDEPEKVTAFKNALIYQDMVLSSLIQHIDELDKKNNQRTMIVMVADHGEMLEEKDNNRLAGHGSYIRPLLANLPCIIIRPEANGLKINKNLGSQIDVLPTVLDYLGLKPSTQRYCQGLSLAKPLTQERPIYLSSLKSYALIENGCYFEYQEKEVARAKVFKINLSNENRTLFQEIKGWPQKDIEEKYERIKKFYKLQEQLSKHYLTERK